MSVIPQDVQIVAFFDDTSEVVLESHFRSMYNSKDLRDKAKWYASLFKAVLMTTGITSTTREPMICVRWLDSRIEDYTDGSRTRY